MLQTAPETLANPIRLTPILSSMLAEIKRLLKRNGSFSLSLPQAL
jgi:hypothetical protein